MKRVASYGLIAAALALAGAGAAAQTAGAKTREQVRSELAQAIREGTIPYGETGLTPREMFPDLYPKPAVAPGKTRAQALAELDEARRNGDLIPNGESGLTLREMHPDRYPRREAVAGKTREQVKAELAEAIRTGDIYAGGESGLKLNQLYPDQYPKARRPMYAGAPAEAASAAGMRR